jgi:hypothetical protein
MNVQDKKLIVKIKRICLSYDQIIWDRLVFFYDYLDIYMNDKWRRDIEKKNT